MKINEFAKLCGINSKTIRYYEAIGLLPEPARHNNGYREYHPKDAERLIFIRRCRELQIPLDKLRKLVLVQSDESASCSGVDRIIAEQLEKVRAAKRELALLEKTLNSLAQSCQKDIIGECEILHRLTGRQELTIR
jgi:DNA-binding transcriptional MerR regulator